MLEFGQYNPQKIFFLRSYFYTLVVILSSGKGEIPLLLPLLYRFWHLHGQGNFYAEGIFQKNIFSYSNNIFEKIFFQKLDQKMKNTEKKIIGNDLGMNGVTMRRIGRRFLHARSLPHPSKLSPLGGGRISLIKQGKS